MEVAHQGVKGVKGCIKERKTRCAGGGEEPTMSPGVQEETMS